eukprot:jgi/Tetstr1/461220/TSEL_006357.t1
MRLVEAAIAAANADKAAAIEGTPSWPWRQTRALWTPRRASYSSKTASPRWSPPSKRTSRRPPPTFTPQAGRALRPAVVPMAAPAVAARAKHAPDDKAFVEAVKAPKCTCETTHIWMDAHGAIHDAHHTYEASVMQAEVNSLRAFNPLVRNFLPEGRRNGRPRLG